VTGPEPGAVEGDEVLVDEAVANDEVVVQREFERGADPVVGVEADAVAIAGEDEEEVERTLGVAELCEEALVQELVGDEGEATGDAANPFWPWWGAMRRSAAGVGGHVSLGWHRDPAHARPACHRGRPRARERLLAIARASMSIRSACMARRSRMVAVRVASPR
jgi:hypothetical protein